MAQLSSPVMPVGSTPAHAPSPLDCVAQAMAEVDTLIGQRLHSPVLLVQQVARHIVAAGGKRLRPALLLLFAHALQAQGPKALELAAVVEFIHTATLLHDDVVDESHLRRGRPTANAVFGNPASVLVGDFLYSRAFQMMVSVNQLKVLEVLAEATNVIAEGEVLQLMNMHDPDLGVEDYLQVIRFKTAKLFEASARLGAVLAQAEPAVEKACAEYGRCLGTAFQLIDDALDYDGSTAELGKNIGDDLREGKATLPLLLAMKNASPDEQALLRQAIEQGDEEHLPQILDIVRRTGALSETREVARQQVAMAQACLDALPPSAYRDALLQLARMSVDRSF
jgi:octaprenyl-diphosphate synthase